ncbi:type IX secretion system membrane protein PorP/SprF [Subsaximicrobium wynnwilliamsii]|uniref:Type IX secretion system membrane protein PorP/SprF n=1 Tax=Subsaximicrobium wynnwilliamsii TaxID=291179 RepID=A0A5C6ZIK2_9FLAO|nr:type IX secretion system membrane protein PorP/SprF [Subsaximicrobium wynnwilliamsii]TXD82805.1 type IX secretion system membrane protein PorP/SprF [Subsaximicrobium wynnwilliamsii]TXD88529.1 type IX secretion system membrane protein PorP/SprF [Subsaximicrobium wynnwilliamsii]TXE02475.1 type IX secretion system membrane protein PorP/SprF [Subsaximicrobium wynnwilliamsii]
MIHKLITYSIFTLILFLGWQAKAQQDPQFTQYMYNMSVLNPAYATADESTINLGTLYRTQWVGSVGAPSTGTLFAHSKLTDRLEGGFSIIHDQIGDVVKETNAYIDVAYVLPAGETAKISFGIKAGATFFSTDFNGFIYSDPLPDPAFAENISRTFPNIGAGVFYFTDAYYLGLSAPNLLQSKHLRDESGIVTEGTENAHLFLTGGYVFQLNERLKLKPAFMTRYIGGAPIAVDLTANVLINDTVELGAGYRFDDSVSALVNFAVTPSLRIGYAYDYTLSNLGRFNSGSHEVFILFNISRLTKGYDKSPRFF